METGYSELLKESRGEYLRSKYVIRDIIEHLAEFEDVQSFRNRRVGIYKFAKRLLACFDDLYSISSEGSIASIITLNRMIIDNYSVFYLLTSFSTEQERNLRYFLYLKDGISTRSEVLRDFHSRASKEVQNYSDEKTKSVLESDSKSIEQLNNCISANNSNDYISDKIIQQNNWKFIESKSNRNKRDNAYSWIQLYNLARIPGKYSNAFQKYYSSYVHGLGITLMLRSEGENIPMLISALSSTAIIMSLIVKAMLLEYDEELGDFPLDLDFINYMNSNWGHWNK